MNNKTYDSTKAHIVYASDDGFAEILGVSLVSLFENSKDMSDIQIYILDSGISIQNRRLIEKVSKQYNRQLPIWIKALNICEVLDMNVDVDRGSLSQYARLFISSNLPNNISRVLYLDCDIIINQSISELWNIDMQGKTIAALNDAFSKYYRANIDLQPNDIMFNSGVMLINLDKWKNNNVEEKLLSFISKKKGKIQQGDQGALNNVLSRETYCFHPRFNSVTIFYDFSYEEMMIYRKPIEGFYSREEIKEAVDNPVIIHFTTSFLSNRPWEKRCGHIYCNKWLRYKLISPWAEEPLREKRCSAKGKFIYNIIRIMPRKTLILIASIFQVYARPIKNKLVDWLP